MLADAGPVRLLPAQSSRANRIRKVASVGRCVLDRYPVRHRRSAWPNERHRVQYNQRSNHWRKRTRFGRIHFENTGVKRVSFLCDRLRHSPQVASFRRTLRIDHGGQRFPRLFPGRVSRDASVVVCGSGKKMLMRNHGYRIP